MNQPPEPPPQLGCPKCGWPQASGSNFCPNCGTRPGYPSARPSTVGYWLLLFLVGGPLALCGSCFALMTYPGFLNPGPGPSFLQQAQSVLWLLPALIVIVFSIWMIVRARRK